LGEQSRFGVADAVMGEILDVFRFDQDATAIADQYRAEGSITMIARTFRDP
jgi:hypothetical protein